MKIPNDYFNKIVMRSTATILLLVLVFFLFFGNFNTYQIKVCCPDRFECDNPIYLCKDININNYYECKVYSKFNCEGQEICNIEKIPPKTCLRSDTTWINKNLIPLYLLILGLGLVVNHYIYMKKLEGDEK